MTRAFNIYPAPSVPILQEEPDNSDGESLVPTIVEKLYDTNFSASLVLRLIAVEIARLIRRMRVQERSVKIFVMQINALRVLADSIRQFDVHRKESDALDFDGPKFRFVFDQFVLYVEQALREAMGQTNQVMVNNVLRHLRDIIATNEPELRRETEKIG